MGVVDEDDHRIVFSDIGDQPVQAVVDARGLNPGRGLPASERRRGEPGCAGQEALTLVRPRHREPLPEQLAHDPVAPVAFELSSSRLEGRRLRLQRNPAQLPQQARLPDAGLALDDHQRAVAGPRSRMGGAQELTLAIALD
jgi:hypothetical protein